MAVVKGVREMVHLPLYDAISVRPGRRLGEILSSNILRFFQDVTGKTKLLTNMQASSLLPHWNTYEARALRVTISDIPAVLPDTPTASIPDIKIQGGSNHTIVTLDNFTLTHFSEFKRRVEGEGGSPVELSQRDLLALGLKINELEPDLGDGEFITIDRQALKGAEGDFRESNALPINEQVIPNYGFGTVIGKLIYNTVTTFFVGEKIMIQVPTWYFPAGAGPYSHNENLVTHGFPSPEATFRFAEAVKIDAQQNFRVELEVSESEVLGELQRVYGPLLIWVTLDGYMTRDVQ
jgi:hypothetical protein